MPTGMTTTSALTDSLPSLIQSARAVQDYDGVMTQLVHRVRLGEGMGNTWNEISLARLTASRITETTEENNPQQLADTLLSITPSMISVQTRITDRVARNISKNVWGKTAPLAQLAIERLKDQDGLVILDSGTSLGGAASTLTSGHVAAATSRIRGNTTEPWSGPVAFVLHSFQKKDLFDEFTAGVGTYPVPAGATADVFKNGFSLGIDGATGFTDDNITIDASDDAKGGAFASGANGAIILVQARNPSMKVVRKEEIGGGANDVFHRDEYAYGIRQSAWLFELYSDATAPTS